MNPTPLATLDFYYRLIDPWTTLNSRREVGAGLDVVHHLVHPRD